MHFSMYNIGIDYKSEIITFSFKTYVVTSTATFVVVLLLWTYKPYARAYNVAPCKQL